jgi:hypothetical protein
VTLYMNNSGSRWIETNKQGNRIVVVHPDGTRHIQQAVYYESFGNFAVTAYRYKGKIYRAFPKSASGHETRLGTEYGIDALPHVFHISEDK